MRKLTILFSVFLFCSAVCFADSVYKSQAVASFYADKYHGRMTANGEIFNMYAMTCAHKTLPFNTMLKVTNLSNGKSVMVRVNDRGPFVAGREIDLSKGAAGKLDMIKSGTAKVSITIVDSKVTTTVSGSQKKVTKVKVLDEKSMRWDIQLGSFSKRENAVAFAQKILKAGFKNVVYQKTSSVTRVVIRDVATDDVQPILDRLEAKGFDQYLVKERR